MSASITVSAPGKIILHGEHAVVYGKKAIACAIDGCIETKLSKEEGESINLFMSNLMSMSYEEPICISNKSLQDLYHVCSKQVGNMDTNAIKWHEEIKKFVSSSCLINETDSPLLIVAVSAFIVGYFKIILEKGVSVKNFSLHVKNNQLPVGAGLGSSAAYNVSVATTLLLYAGQITPTTNHTDITLDTASLLTINKIAYNMEKVVHGNPSGIDNSVSTFGGALVYEAGKSTQLPKFPEIDLLVVDSGVSRNTKALVSSVRQKTEQFPVVMQCVMDSIHAISNSAEELFMQMSQLNDEDESKKMIKKVKELVQMNQHLLNAIGVGHSELDKICEIATKFNCGSKLTGAGGGGCALILVHGVMEEEVSNLQKSLSSRGYKCWKTTLACEGVKVVDYVKLA